MTDKLVPGIFIFTVGGFYVVRADLILKFQIWVSRKVYGLKIEPSERTYKMYRFVGALFMVMGLSILVF